MLVENIAFDKLVEVHWAGEDKVWHTLRAEYHSSSEQSWSRLSEQLFRVDKWSVLPRLGRYAE